MQYNVRVDSVGHTISLKPIEYKVTIANIGAQGPSGNGETNGASSLGALTDVTVVSPENNQLLIFDSASNQWINKTLSIGGSNFNPTTNTSTVQANNIVIVDPDDLTVNTGDISTILQEGSTILGEVNTTFTQGKHSISIGSNIEGTSQGESAINIGAFIGTTSNNSIVINALEELLNATTQGLFIKPIRQDAIQFILSYNPSSGEVTYAPLNTYNNDTLLAQINAIKAYVGMP